VERVGAGRGVGELYIIESVIDKLVEIIANILFGRVRGLREEAKNNDK